MRNFQQILLQAMTIIILFAWLYKMFYNWKYKPCALYNSAWKQGI